MYNELGQQVMNAIKIMDDMLPNEDNMVTAMGEVTDKKGNEFQIHVTIVRDKENWLKEREINIPIDEHSSKSVHY